MRHFDMVNLFLNVIWTEPKNCEGDHIVDETPEAHRQRFFNFLDSLEERKFCAVVEAVTKKMELQQGGKK